MKKLLLVALSSLGFFALGHSSAQAGPREREVYVIENDRPFRRVVYFDESDRCYTFHGPRRVYVTTYFNEYPRYWRRPAGHFHDRGEGYRRDYRRGYDEDYRGYRGAREERSSYERGHRYERD